MEVKVFIASILAALGVFVAPDAYLGGLFICSALAYAAMIFSPPEGRLSFWSTMFLAFLAGTTVAQLHGHFFKTLPLQPLMGLAGAISRPLMKAVMTFGASLPERVMKIKLPWEKE